MIEIPALPRGLVTELHERADSARAEAIRRARAGADEGTLVVVERPTAPVGRHGEAWLLSESPGLHAALVLRPGLPATECAELAPAAAVALGRATGELVEPMTELHYRWPNDVLLDHGKAAGIWLDGGGTPEAVEWLVVSWSVNVDAAPESLGHGAAALAREGRREAPAAGELLQAVVRELLASITTWDESGFGAILRNWRGRIALDAPVSIRTADGGPVEGEAARVDEAGALVVRREDGERTLALNDFFGLPGEAA